MNEDKINKPKEETNKESQSVTRRDLIKGAAAIGLGAMALGNMETTTQAAVKNKIKPGPHSLYDLISKMAQDPDFSLQVIANPKQYQQEYNLSNKAVYALRGLYAEDFTALATKIKDPQSFAAGALTVASITKGEFNMETALCGCPDNQDGGSCYYFG